MAYTQTNWIDGATPLNRTNMMKIEDELAALDPRVPVAALSYGTTLPGSPVDGQEAILVNSTTNPLWQWRFRYNAANTTAYKWEFVGGTPFSTFDATTRSTVVGWTWLGEGALTVPRAGIYTIEVFVGVITIGTAPANTVVAVGANPNTQASATNNAQTTLVVGLNAASLAHTVPSTLGSGDVLVIFLYGSAAGATTTQRTLRITPVRVS